MKAVTYQGPWQVAVDTVKTPTIQDPLDAVVKITSSALCGSDLHMYEGRIPPELGMVFGHEVLGVVQAVGSSVRLIQEGMRVVLPAHVYCGVCVNCARGRSAECLTMRPGKVGAAFGYANKGNYPGGQAEFIRVPFADANCVPLPGTPGDEWEDDFLMLADGFVSGWHATDLASVKAGSTVAVFGAGPIGLLSAYSALLRGASQVFVVDYVPERLRMAKTLGAIPINFGDQDPVEQIMAHRMKSGLPPGESMLPGVDSGIDAVGFQAIDRMHPEQENPSQVIQDLARLVNPGGSLGIIGVFPKHDQSPVQGNMANGQFTVPWGLLFSKGIQVGMGRTNDRQYNRMLRDLILSKPGVHPGKIVTHHAGLDEAPTLYKKFAHREDGVIKVVFHP